MSDLKAKNTFFFMFIIKLINQLVKKKGVFVSLF